MRSELIRSAILRFSLAVVSVAIFTRASAQAQNPLEELGTRAAQGARDLGNDVGGIGGRASNYAKGRYISVPRSQGSTSGLTFLTPPSMDRDGWIYNGTTRSDYPRNRVGRGQLHHDANGQGWWYSDYGDGGGRVKSPVPAFASYNRPAPAPPPAATSSPNQPRVLGISAAQTISLSNGQVALQILGVEPNTPAQRAGLGQGTIITAANGFPITNKDQLRQIITTSSGPMRLTYWNYVARQWQDMMVTMN